MRSRLKGLQRQSEGSERVADVGKAHVVSEPLPGEPYGLCFCYHG